MRFEAVTIKDIAKELKLSTSTVSRALRDSYEISAETKKLVIEYAEKINYRPNPIALSLKERRTRSLGIIVCEIANSFFSQIIDGMESVAHSRGYNVTFLQSHESFVKENLNLEYLASRSVDGLLISVSTETKDFSHLIELSNRGLPIVFFDRIVDEIDTHKVIINNYKGAYNAVNHLVEKGYKRIAYLANSELLTLTKDRLNGYKKVLSENKIELDEKLIRYCSHGGMINDEVEKALDELFALKKKPDAIFAASDKLTTGCLHYFKKHNIKVPKQVALVGFSNNENSDLFNPALTVVKQPAFEMGEIAANYLLELIESKRPIIDYETRILDTELIIRESA